MFSTFKMNSILLCFKAINSDSHIALNVVI